MGPQRVKLRRTKGWRLPAGAKSVARPTRWGNPFRVVQLWDHQFGWTYRAVGGDLHGPDRLYRTEAIADAVDLFRLHAGPMGSFEIDQADLDLLRGADLACWCPLDGPCHADVLGDWANR